MKFELRKINTKFFDTSDDEDYEIYITRRQFMKEYEIDCFICTEFIQTIAEMYTSRHCFESLITKEIIDNIYNYFLEHKSIKGISLQIIDTNVMSNDLKIYFVK